MPRCPYKLARAPPAPAQRLRNHLETVDQGANGSNSARGEHLVPASKVIGAGSDRGIPPVITECPSHCPQMKIDEGYIVCGQRLGFPIGELARLAMKQSARTRQNMILDRNIENPPLSYNASHFYQSVFQMLKVVKNPDNQTGVKSAINERQAVEVGTNEKM